MLYFWPFFCYNKTENERRADDIDIRTVQYFFFDLDGTLTDPGIGITNSVMYALRKMGIEPPAREKLYSFIGPPLLDSFRQQYRMSPEEAQQALSYYREYFSETGLYENTVYGGIPELLSAAAGRGIRIVLATSKPLPFSERILKHFGLDPYFCFCSGSTMDEKRVKKEEVIAYALEKLSIRPEEAGRRVLMVGDRHHDVEGAHALGIPCVGVLYGYGSREELRACGADCLAESVEALRGILLPDPGERSL